MKLYIIRHGETDWNKAFRLQGQSDVPLNEYGRQLARITADALKDIAFDVIYSSPLSRALETAQIIRRERQVPIITDERLKEISFGADEGKSKDELGEHFSNFFFAPDKFVPSQGGESYETVCRRAEDFFRDQIEPLRKTAKTVLIAAHGTMNKALMLHMKNIAIRDIWKGEFQKNCCVNYYELTEDTVTVIEEAKIYYDSETTDFLEKQEGLDV